MTYDNVAAPPSPAADALGDVKDQGEAGLVLAPANRLIACASPFSDRRVDHELPHGMTIAQMLDAVDLKPAYRQFAHVWLCDPEFKKDPVFVAAENWHRVRPRPGVVVTLRVAPGKGGGGKSTIGLVLQIAILAISAAATAFIPLPWGPLIGAAVPFTAALLIASSLKGNLHDHVGLHRDPRALPHQPGQLSYHPHSGLS